MAKRELSSTLKNLKFMQRAAQKEKKTEKEGDIKPDGNFSFPGVVHRKCVVVTEGDPHPGAVLGRMSFQSFNPSVDKLNEEAQNSSKPVTLNTNSSNHGGRTTVRENGFAVNEAECSKGGQSETNGEHKRKQSELASEPQFPNKRSPKNAQVAQESSPSQSKALGFKQPKRDKVNWSVLRPPKPENRKAKQ